MSEKQHKMADKFHCYECAGRGKLRGYECNTCDGEGNLKVIPKVIPKEIPTEKPKKKVK